MSINQAAPAAESDCCPDTIGLTMVPNHLVPCGPAGTPLPGGTPGGTSAHPVAAPVAGPPDPERPWAQQFAVLLAETLAGVRPARQVLPWLSNRGSAQLHRLMPLFSGGHRPRVVRVLTSKPRPEVIEMTMVVVAGPRVRALAVRLERRAAPERTARQGRSAVSAATEARGRATATRWICTDIEAG
jgi:hypothetical protein